MTTPNVAYGVYNGYAPKGGPRAMTFLLEFTASVTEIPIDMYIEEAARQLEFVQTAWIENQDSAQDFILDVQGTQQTIVVPAGMQAILPIFSMDQTKLIARSQGQKTIKLILLNVPLGPCVWGTAPGP